MTARAESPNWNRHLVARVPDALFNLVDNEAIAGCTNRSDIVRKALRHYFNCNHAHRHALERPSGRSNGRSGSGRRGG